MNMTSEKQNLDLIVEHARLEPGQDPPTLTFLKTTKIGEAATTAATKLGFSPEGTYTFSFRGETLERNRPLVSYGLKDGDTVVLTDIGRAVAD
jgi:hypothetical protein